MLSKISPFLWFDDQAEAAAQFYTSIFPNSKITQVSRYADAGQEIHGKPAGTVMTVTFELDGLTFTALNGGPQFKFDEAISFKIECETQEEVDYYWEKLLEGCNPGSDQCGWLKDKFGLSWQVVPAILPSLLGEPGSAGAQRTMAALLKMKKLDVGALQRAYEGNDSSS